MGVFYCAAPKNHCNWRSVRLLITPPSAYIDRHSPGNDKITPERREMNDCEASDPL